MLAPRLANLQPAERNDRGDTSLPARQSIRFDSPHCLTMCRVRAHTPHDSSWNRHLHRALLHLSSVCQLRRKCTSTQGFTLFSISHPCVDPTEAPPKRYLTPMVVAAQLAKERPGLCPPRPVDCFNEIVRRSSSFAFTPLRKLATDWMANEGQTNPKMSLPMPPASATMAVRTAWSAPALVPASMSPPPSRRPHRIRSTAPYPPMPQASPNDPSRTETYRVDHPRRVEGQHQETAQQQRQQEPGVFDAFGVPAPAFRRVLRGGSRGQRQVLAGPFS